MQEFEQGQPTPKVEDVQDMFLNAEVRAAAARNLLGEMMDGHRQQVEEAANTIHGLRHALRSTDAARMLAEDDNRRLAAQVADLENQIKHLHGNIARLHDGFGNMLRHVEDSATAGMGLNERMDAMIMHKEVGYGMEAGQPLRPAPRVAQFHRDVFPDTQMRVAPLQPMPQHPAEAYRQDDRRESTYAHQPQYHQHSQHPYRNER